MTPEAQRIAIAEACGWKYVTQGPEHDSYSGWSIKGCFPQEIDRLPDYLSDLNAMHEAEKVIIEQGKWVTYDVVLKELLTIKRPSPTFATAAQRAEAFLRTLNL